mgnify:CR=1 FL=1
MYKRQVITIDGKDYKLEANNGPNNLHSGPDLYHSRLWECWAYETEEGSRAYYNEMMVEVKSFLQKNTIETTGAGDTFCGCVLHYICEHGMEGLEEENLKEMLTFANAAASVITTRKGALRVMPTRDEIQNLQC